MDLALQNQGTNVRAQVGAAHETAFFLPAEELVD